MTGEKIRLLYFAVLLIAAGCKDQFNPPATAASLNYLVVDGFINTGNTATNFKLSRTLNIKDTVLYKPESSASINVESDNGFISYLKEDSAGSYSGGPYNFQGNGQYRLHIRTSDGKEYLSDFVAVNISPAIDSVGWERNNNGVSIYLNTHGQNNNSRYYHWRYTQTWKFHSAYESSLEYKDGYLILRRNPDSIYTCWHTEEANTLLLSSSAALSENVIYRQPIISIPENSWQISDKYSILVKQEAIDEEAYNYMQILRKVTEQAGTIFDPQPYTVNGNIHCINDQRQVAIGHIYATSVSEKRIFIDNSELPGWRYRSACDTFRARNATDFQLAAAGYYVPLFDDGKGIMMTTGICGDCTQRGTHAKPDFWP